MEFRVCQFWREGEGDEPKIVHTRYYLQYRYQDWHPWSDVPIVLKEEGEDKTSD